MSEFEREMMAELRMAARRDMMSEYDVAEWEDLKKDRDHWKMMAELRMDGWEAEQDVAYYWKSKADEWRLRANHAKNLAQDLADVLKALRKRGLLHLDWRDESAGAWHDIPKSWREYITRG